MFRIALIALMLLQSMTGPNPCCCTLGRLVAAVTSLTGLGGDYGISAYSCCHMGFEGALGADKTESESCCQSHGPKPAKERCKCQKGNCSALPLQITNVKIDDTSRSWIDHLALSLAAPLISEAVELFALAEYLEQMPPPLRSGRAKCIAFQSWQC